MTHDKVPVSAWDWEYDLYYPGSTNPAPPSDEAIFAELTRIRDEAPVEREAPRRVQALLSAPASDNTERISGVYAIECTATSQQYVGSSIDVHRRRQQHLTQLHAGKHHSKKLQQAFVEHGRSTFRFRILETVSDLDELRVREQAWIDSTKAYSNGLNSSATATGPEPSAARRLVTLVQSTASRFLADPPVPPTEEDLDEYRRALDRFRRSKVLRTAIRIGAALAILALIAARPEKIAGTLVLTGIPFGLLLLLTASGDPPDPPRYRKISPLRRAAELVADKIVTTRPNSSRADVFGDIVEALIWERELRLTGKHFATKRAGYASYGDRRSRRKEAVEYVEELMADSFVDSVKPEE